MIYLSLMAFKVNSFQPNVKTYLYIIGFYQFIILVLLIDICKYSIDCFFKCFTAIFAVFKAFIVRTSMIIQNLARNYFRGSRYFLRMKQSSLTVKLDGLCLRSPNQHMRLGIFKDWAESTHCSFAFAAAIELARVNSLVLGLSAAVWAATVKGTAAVFEV